MFDRSRERQGRGHGKPVSGSAHANGRAIAHSNSGGLRKKRGGAPTLQRKKRDGARKNAASTGADPNTGGYIVSSGATTPAVGATVTYELKPAERFPLYRGGDRCGWMSHKLEPEGKGVAGSASLDEAAYKVTITWSRAGSHTLRFLYADYTPAQRTAVASLTVEVIDQRALSQHVQGAITRAKRPEDLQPLLSQMNQKGFTARSTQITDAMLGIALKSGKPAVSLHGMIAMLRVKLAATKSTWQKDQLNKMITALSAKAQLLRDKGTGGAQCGDSSPIKGAIVDTRSGRTFTLQLFAGANSGGQYVLIDATNPMQPAHYAGATLDAAVTAFRTNNTYPTTTRIRLQSPQTSNISSNNLEFAGCGGTMWDSISSVLTWLAIGATVAAMTAATLGVGTVAVGVLGGIGAAAGVGATAANAQSQSSRGTYTNTQAAIDIASVAADLLTLGAARIGKAIALGAKATRGEKAYLAITTLANGTELVANNAQYVNALQLILRDKHLKPDERRRLLTRTLEMAAQANALRIVPRVLRLAAGRKAMGGLVDGDGALQVTPQNANHIVRQVADTIGMSRSELRGVNVVYDPKLPGKAKLDVHGETVTLRIGQKPRYYNLVEDLMHLRQHRRGGGLRTNADIAQTLKSGSPAQKRQLALDIHRTEIEVCQAMLGLPVGVDRPLPADTFKRLKAVQRLDNDAVRAVYQRLLQHHAAYQSAKNNPAAGQSIQPGYFSGFKIGGYNPRIAQLQQSLPVKSTDGTTPAEPVSGPSATSRTNTFGAGDQTASGRRLISADPDGRQGSEPVRSSEPSTTPTALARVGSATDHSGGRKRGHDQRHPGYYEADEMTNRAQKVPGTDILVVWDGSSVKKAGADGKPLRGHRPIPVQKGQITTFSMTTTEGGQTKLRKFEITPQGQIQPHFDTTTFAGTGILERGAVASLRQAALQKDWPTSDAAGRTAHFKALVQQTCAAHQHGLPEPNVIVQPRAGSGQLEGSFSPQTWTITIYAQDYAQALKTLTHELRHADQYWARLLYVKYNNHLAKTPQSSSASAGRQQIAYAGGDVNGTIVNKAGSRAEWYRKELAADTTYLDYGKQFAQNAGVAGRDVLSADKNVSTPSYEKLKYERDANAAANSLTTPATPN